MFNEKDIKFIESKGLTMKDIEGQIENFRRGFPFIRLAMPATIGKGILAFPDHEADELSTYFKEHARDYEIVKFVPASGAASRMFKELLNFREHFDTSKVSEAELKDDRFDSPANFFKNLKKFAFYEDLVNILNERGHQVDKLISEKRYDVILDAFLGSTGMNYAGLPKGLLLFHYYPDGSRLALEEHLVESIHYGRGKSSTLNIHLTVSPEHRALFEDAVEKRKVKYEAIAGHSFSVTFSKQKPSTDTLAVGHENTPFREEDGSLLFRPGGHGALIENLNDLDAELIFIKNIDNVVPDRLKEETYRYKQVLGGLLIRLQEKAFEYLDLLEGGNLSREELQSARTFAEEELNIFIPPAYQGYDDMEKVDFLFNALNRPMRVCGMVRNEGEPGGGPFWVRNDRDELSLQIVESSQIDFNDAEQKEIVQGSTHFNPVDLVCAVRNFRGDPFNLLEFIDPATGFITSKSKDGKELKAQELPGLWNGAMADWISVFVEVPLITFNPVKTINDLLRPQHQPEQS